MKVIITGATGFVGSECLRQCILNPRITSIIALSRRPLKEGQHADVADLSSSKLSVVIPKDFTNYPAETMQQLEGAEACIWTLGTVPRKHEAKESTLTSIDFPKAAFEAWNKTLKPAAGPFRFVYLSGAMAERNQAKTTMIPGVSGEYLKIRGQTENNLIAAESANPDSWKSFILRMGKALGRDQTWINMAVPWGVIKVDEAAACIIDLALNGGEQQTLNNTEMKDLGHKVLAAA